jgi:hypothetical protein
MDTMDVIRSRLLTAATVRSLPLARYVTGEVANTTDDCTVTKPACPQVADPIREHLEA